MTKKLAIFIFGAAVIVALASSVFIIFNNKPRGEAPPEKTVPLDEAPLTIEPVETIEESCATPFKNVGKQTRVIPLDASKGFQIVRVDIDPVDIKTKNDQTIIVKLRDLNNNIITRESGVSATIITDNATATIPFKLIRAEDEIRDPEFGPERALMTSWMGVWTKQDSTCHIYTEIISAIDNEGDKFSIELDL